jgi:exodeoxyribonuclease VII small subunit
MGIKKLTYQEAFDQLQIISEQIKKEAIPIELLPEQIQKAKALVKYCKELLRKVDEELNDSVEEE